MVKVLLVLSVIVSVSAVMIDDTGTACVANTFAWPALIFLYLIVGFSEFLYLVF